MRNKEVSERRGITNIYTGSGTVTLHHYYINSTTNKMFSNASKLYFQALFSPQAIFPTTIKYLFHLNFFLLSVTTDLSRFIPINFPTSSLLIFLENIFFLYFLYTCNLPTPPFSYLPGQFLAISWETAPMSPYKAFSKLMPLYSQLKLVTLLSMTPFSKNTVIITSICLCVFL